MIKEYEIGDGRKVGVVYDNGVAQVSKETMEQMLIPAYIKAEKYKWHDLMEDPGDLPKAEEKVQVLIERRYADKNKQPRIMTTFALYENGKIYSEDSDWCWEDIDDWNDAGYDEEKDDYIIPEGWWEYSLYSESNEKIDDFVIKWREPFEEVEE